MSDPSDLRYVLVDIEGMQDGDLVQYSEGHFEKFRPFDNWVDLAPPANWSPLEDLLEGLEAGDVDPLPPFSYRMDGLGGVHLRGAICASLEDIVFMENGEGILLATMPEEARPTTKAVVMSSLICIDFEKGTMQVPATLQITPDGELLIQHTNYVGGWEVENALTSILDPDTLCVANTNGSYDTLA